MRSLLRVLAAALCGLLAAAPAQGPTGVINGQVLDSSQSAMPGVSVTARHLGTGDTRVSVTQRVNLVSGASLESARQHGGDEVEAWFDTAAVQKAFGPGSTPRNFLRGPDQKRVDLSISKALRLGARIRAELRWEIFNLLNTANLGLPNNNIDSVEFGRITNTVGGPRVSQFGLRVAF